VEFLFCICWELENCWDWVGNLVFGIFVGKRNWRNLIELGEFDGMGFV